MNDQVPVEVLDRFRFVAAKKTLSEVSTEDIVSLANQTLANGVYHDALLGIIDSHPQTQDVINPKFQSLCDEYGIPIGDTKWALQFLLDHFLSRMALPDSDVYGEWVDLMHAVGPEQLGEIFKNQHALGLDRILLLGIQYNYFDQLHNVPPDELASARQACIRLVPEFRHAAKEWLKRFGAMSGDVGHIH